VVKAWASSKVKNKREAQTGEQHTPWISECWFNLSLAGLLNGVSGD